MPSPRYSRSTTASRKVSAPQILSRQRSYWMTSRLLDTTETDSHYREYPLSVSQGIKGGLYSRTPTSAAMVAQFRTQVRNFTTVSAPDTMIEAHLICSTVRFCARHTCCATAAISPVTRFTS
jgi:hypothetical protein